MMQQIRRMQATRKRRDNGFTLIELLVVIVVLAVLSAVVVFAVRGTGDKGASAAFGTDLKTMRTAQEAYCAQHGTYAPNDAALLNDKFISEVGTLTHTVRTASGACGGTGFAITCDPAVSTCGQNGTTPDANFKGTAPLGTWTRTGDLPAGSTTGGAMVTMSNGKALLIARPSTTGPPSVAIATTGGLPGQFLPPVYVFDPSTAKWSVVSGGAVPSVAASTGPFPLPAPVSVPAYPNYPNYIPVFTSQLLTIKGGASECGSNCGKTLLMVQLGQSGNARSIGPDYQDNLFYLFDPAAFDAGNNPWTRVPDPDRSTVGVSGHGSTIIQIDNCTRATSPDCGRVLVTGGLDNNATNALNQNGGGSFDPMRFKVSLWDPAVALSVASWSSTDGTGRVFTPTSTNGSTTLTAPDGNFTTNDVGKRINFSAAGFPNPTRVQSVQSTTSVTMDAAATATATATVIQGSGQASIGSDPLAPNQVASLKDGRILAAVGDSLVYSPATHLWSISANRQSDFTFTCPSFGAPATKTHGPTGGVVMADGRVLSVNSYQTTSNQSSGSCYVVGSATPPENSTVFDPNAATPWALAPGVFPGGAVSRPNFVVLPPAFGNKVFYAQALGSNPMRTVTASMTSGSSTITGAANTFLSSDIGRAIQGLNMRPGAYISAVAVGGASATLLSGAATATGVGVSLTIGNGWATSALYNGTSWSSVDASSLPTARIQDINGNPLATTASNGGYPSRVPMTMLPSGQVLIAGGNKCTASPCAVNSISNGLADTWLYTPAT